LADLGPKSALVADDVDAAGEIYASEVVGMTRSLTTTPLPIREEMMAEVREMRGDKIYELELNITGVTDYGVTMDAILSGKEKVPLQGARLTWHSRGMAKAASQAKYVASITWSCVPTDALTSTSEPH
jgi:hypothetical protein